MSKHIETRRKVKAIHSVSEFNILLENTILTEDEKALMRMHYLEKKDFRFIGDKLGYAEITMKRWHAKILEKISSVL